VAAKTNPGRFLFKTEPSSYSYARLAKEGRAVWDGVTNPVALRHLAEVRAGDQVLIYHTGGEKSVVGLARAASDPYPDPGDRNGKVLVVDLLPVKALARPVTLGAIKADPRFRDFALVRQGRLSVTAVPEDLWQAILRMGGERG